MISLMKKISLILFVIVTLAGIGCINEQELPDLDATVEARVSITVAAQTLSSDPTKSPESIPSDEYIEIIFKPGPYERINSLKESVTNVLIEFLITNTHSSKDISINRVGWQFGKKSVNYSGYGVQRHQVDPCIGPGETVKVRFDSKVDITSYDVDDFKYNQMRSNWCEPSMGVDESLLKDVSVDITRKGGSFYVSITNNSPTYIGWTGVLLRKDVEGNIITKTRFITPSAPCISPGGTQSVEAKSSLDFFGKEYKLDNLYTIYSDVTLVEPEFKTLELYKCD
jgi:hypothetical protein